MSKILKLIPKRSFDPNSSVDMLEYKNFKEKGKWATPCPFELEYPYVNIPLMINDKIVNHVLGKL